MTRCISVDSASPGEEGKKQTHSTIRNININTYEREKDITEQACVGVRPGVGGAASAHRLLCVGSEAAC